MDVSEDGTVTGSIDVAALGDVEPTTDEAKAQVDALKARIAEGEVAEEDAEADEADTSGESDAEASEVSDEDDVEALRAEAEGLGVNVDGRWGAERLRQEIDAAKAEG